MFGNFVVTLIYNTNHYTSACLYSVCDCRDSRISAEPMKNVLIYYFGVIMKTSLANVLVTMANNGKKRKYAVKTISDWENVILYKQL